MSDFTVAIPTYNGEHRLPEVLDQLRSQINLEQLRVEVIVVDNNSNDGTAAVVARYQRDFPFPLRYCLETKQGAAFARKRSVDEATSELIGFLDDDNIPANDWIAQAYRFAQHHPQAGAWGSQIHGDFETPPPAHFKRILPFLAITERGSQPRIYLTSQRILPPSAGLVIRRQAWLNSVPEQPVLSGRIEGSMLTGEDLEAIAHLQRAGWEIWYNPAMALSHKIPHWRLTREYLLPFFQGVGLSRHVIRMLRVEPWQRPLLLLAYMANDLRKIVLHLLKHRFNVTTDIVVACEMQLFVSSLISPFYLYTKGYLKEPQPRSANPVEVKSA